MRVPCAVCFGSKRRFSIGQEDYAAFEDLPAAATGQSECGKLLLLKNRSKRPKTVLCIVAFAFEIVQTGKKGRAINFNYKRQARCPWKSPRVTVVRAGERKIWFLFYINVSIVFISSREIGHLSRVCPRFAVVVFSPNIFSVRYTKKKKSRGTRLDGHRQRTVGVPFQERYFLWVGRHR